MKSPVPPTASHWPVLFDKYLDYSLSDPHSILFSIPGTYGVVGVIFYVTLLAFWIFEAVRRRHAARVLALSFILLLFGKDLFSIPYLIGNTPITFALWLAMGVAFMRTAQPSPVTATARTGGAAP